MNYYSKFQSLQRLDGHYFTSKRILDCFTGKLLSRMRKVAFTLLHKKNGLQAGQRVALVYPNSEPIMFVGAYFGCLLANLVPVVVEVPMSSEV